MSLSSSSDDDVFARHMRRAVPELEARWQAHVDRGMRRPRRGQRAAPVNDASDSSESDTPAPAPAAEATALLAQYAHIERRAGMAWIDAKQTYVRVGDLYRYVGPAGTVFYPAKACFLQSRHVHKAAFVVVPIQRAADASTDRAVVASVDQHVVRRMRRGVHRKINAWQQRFVEVDGGSAAAAQWAIAGCGCLVPNRVLHARCPQTGANVPWVACQHRVARVGPGPRISIDHHGTLSHACAGPNTVVFWADPYCVDVRLQPAMVGRAEWRPDAWSEVSIVACSAPGHVAWMRHAFLCEYDLVRDTERRWRVGVATAMDASHAPLVVLGKRNGSVALLDTRSASAPHVVGTTGGKVLQVELTDDAGTCVTRSADGSVMLFDLRYHTGRVRGEALVAPIPHHHDERTEAGKFVLLRRGALVALADGHSQVSVYRTTTHELVARSATCVARLSDNLVVSEADGQTQVAVYSLGNPLRVFDLVPC